LIDKAVLVADALEMKPLSWNKDISLNSEWEEGKVKIKVKLRLPPIQLKIAPV